MMNIVEIESKKIVGISVRTTNSDEMKDETAKIPGMWEKFYGQILNQQVQGQIIYAVYAEYESDLHGKYTVTAGVEQIDDQGRSGDLSVVEIETGDYLVFRGKGEISTIVFETWGKVWEYFSSTNPKYQRKYVTDFEKYISGDEVEIYIAVDQKVASG